ncbi:MAG: hypothetical protein HY329_22035 [Chloroflexi bacterium]|nr:hypothetical protein [Chloroflexota bacterium]
MTNSAKQSSIDLQALREKSDPTPDERLILEMIQILKMEIARRDWSALSKYVRTMEGERLTVPIETVYECARSESEARGEAPSFAELRAE